MAGKDHILKWSQTAASNTDIANIGIQGTNLPSNFDNASREWMKEIADGITRHVTKAAGTYTAALTDHNQFWRCTGAVEIDLTAAATLTTGWCLWIRANGGAVTIDPNGSEQIDGSATSLVLADGQQALIICTGTAFFTVMNTSILTQPTLVLKQGTAPTPTAEGDLQWETDTDRMVVGNGSGQAIFGQVTPLVEYTPTFTGFGTATSISIWSRRVGDCLHIRGRFSPGTPTAVEARMTMGFNGVDGGLTIDSAKVVAGAVQQVGTGAYNVASASQIRILAQNGVAYVTFGYQDAGNAGTTKQTGTAFVGSATVISIDAMIPITDW